MIREREQLELEQHKSKTPHSDRLIEEANKKH